MSNEARHALVALGGTLGLLIASAFGAARRRARGELDRSESRSFPASAAATWGALCDALAQLGYRTTGSAQQAGLLWFKSATAVCGCGGKGSTTQPP